MVQTTHTTKAVTTTSAKTTRGGLSKNETPLSNLGLSEAGPGALDPRRAFNAYTFLVVAIGAIGGLVFGMDIGATGASLDMDGFREEVGWPLLDAPGMPTCGEGAVSDSSDINNKVSGCFPTC